jgi:hypothetical protein
MFTPFPGEMLRFARAELPGTEAVFLKADDFAHSPGLGAEGWMS